MKYTHQFLVLMLVAMLSACGGDDDNNNGTDTGDNGTDTGTGDNSTGGGGITVPEPSDPALGTCPDPNIFGQQPPFLFPAYDGGLCAQGTEATVNACMDQACFEAGITAGGPDCETCLNTNFSNCLTAQFCQTEFDKLNCCVANVCADITTNEEFTTCQDGAVAASGQCADFLEDYQSCGTPANQQTCLASSLAACEDDGSGSTDGGM